MVDEYAGEVDINVQPLGRRVELQLPVARVIAADGRLDPVGWVVGEHDRRDALDHRRPVDLVATQVEQALRAGDHSLCVLVVQVVDDSPVAPQVVVRHDLVSERAAQEGVAFGESGPVDIECDGGAELGSDALLERVELATRLGLTLRYLEVERAGQLVVERAQARVALVKVDPQMQLAVAQGHLVEPRVLVVDHARVDGVGQVEAHHDPREQARLDLLSGRWVADD